MLDKTLALSALREDEALLRKIITVDAAANVLYVLDGEGYPPGSFTDSLIDTVIRADSWNRAKLLTVYPEIVAAIDVYMNHETGRELLQTILYSPHSDSK